MGFIVKSFMIDYIFDLFQNIRSVGLGIVLEKVHAAVVLSEYLVLIARCIAEKFWCLVFAETALPSLFEKYTQASTTHARKYGGTGLGLAICKNLVNISTPVLCSILS